jgi:hypothetical protein
MNYSRIALAAVAATAADAVYGFTVYGTLLAGEFAKYPGVYRAEDVGTSYLPLLFLGVFFAVCVLTAIYAKGYEGRGPAEGLRFGLLIALFGTFAFSSVNYATLNIGRRLALEITAAGFVEWTMIGTIVGLVYKPAVVARRL